MSGFAQPWVPGFDSATSTLVLPLWSAAVLAATIAAFCVFVLARAGRDGIIETATRAGLLLSGAALAWIVLDTTSAGNFAAERRALDARWLEMTTRSAMPGSALACLDATAGDLVEAACEKALFASPEAASASVAYVTAQLSLLSDGSDYERRTGANYEAVLSGLRHAIEADRFGIVAHLLVDRDGCTPERCDTFSFLSDTGLVRENMSGHKYESIVLHYAPSWPQSILSPVAVNNASSAATAAPAAETSSIGASPAAAPVAGAPAAASPAPASTGAAATKPAANGLYFPSSASIPPVSIMNAEPTAPPSQTTPADAPPKSAAPRVKSTASSQPGRRSNSSAPSGASNDQ